MSPIVWASSGVMGCPSSNLARYAAFDRSLDETSRQLAAAMRRAQVLEPADTGVTPGSSGAGSCGARSAATAPAAMNGSEAIAGRGSDCHTSYRGHPMRRVSTRPPNPCRRVRGGGADAGGSPAAADEPVCAELSVSLEEGGDGDARARGSSALARRFRRATPTLDRPVARSRRAGSRRVPVAGRWIAARARGVRRQRHALPPENDGAGEPDRRLTVDPSTDHSA